MPTEVFYHRTSPHGSTVQDFLIRLDTKALARTLSQIDLLEGDELPEEFDQEAVGLPVRVLSVRSGRGRLLIAYMRRGDHAIVIDVSEGKSTKLRRMLADALCPLINEIAAQDDSILDMMKSHREFVAETTLSDPSLASAYSRAREHAQFALSLIRLRKSAGLTVEGMAERTGLTNARIESIERGRIPKLSNMRRIVDALQARIIISPGTGISIEAFHEPKRTLRPKRTPAAIPAAPVQTENGVHNAAS